MNERNKRVAETQSAIADARGEGVAAEGKVVVGVAASGALTDLRIDPRAMRLDAEELAGEILTAVTEARADVSAQVNELAEAVIGQLTEMNDQLRGMPDELDVSESNIDEVLVALDEMRRRLEP